MRVPRFLIWAAIPVCAFLSSLSRGEEAARASGLPSPTAVRGASLKERRATAKSVKVMTGVLGVELGSSLEKAHAKLDKLNDSARPRKEDKEAEGGEKEYKILWQLEKTDYSSIYVKADDEKRVQSITAFVRPGREIPFDKIGEAKKAPVRSETTIAWDVIRPKRAPMRVVASGKNSKANVIKLFVVERRLPTKMSSNVDFVSKTHKKTPSSGAVSVE